MTYLELIAKGMNMSLVDFQILIEKYQNNKDNNIEKKEKELILNEINGKLKTFDNDDLQIIYTIVTNINHNNLNLLHNFLKNMQ